MLLKGDSEMNAVNFLQTGVATFVCPGNIPSSSHVRGVLPGHLSASTRTGCLAHAHTSFLALSPLASHLYCLYSDAYYLSVCLSIYLSIISVYIYICICIIIDQRSYIYIYIHTYIDVVPIDPTITLYVPYNKPYVNEKPSCHLTMVKV